MLNAFFAKLKQKIEVGKNGQQKRGGGGRGEVEGRMFLIFKGLIKDND